MATCEWMLLCRKAEVNPAGELSLLALLDTLLAPNLPAQLADIWLALELVGDPGEQAQVEVAIHFPPAVPGGDVIARFTRAIDEKGRGYHITDLAGPYLPEYGLYWVTVRVDQTEKLRPLLLHPSENV